MPEAMEFEYNTAPSRVIFGPNSIQKLPAELARLNVSRPLLLSGPQQAANVDMLAEILSHKIAGTFTQATMHTPQHITNAALTYAQAHSTDSLVSIGGGSTVGLGKALSIRTGWPHISIPTTYSGSEMTPILGETVDAQKTTRSDPRILPATVLYDANLTLSLSPAASATSGVNALAHAVEALYARTANPITSLLALEGAAALAEALPRIVLDPKDLDARSRALYGAWLCGACLGGVGMALHHKLCHTLGGMFNLPHAQTHTAVLPHALAYNAPAVSKEVMAKLAAALPGSGGDAVVGVNVLLEKLGVGRSLKELGMREEDIDRAAEGAVAKPYWNPRELDQGKIREVIRRAWAGEEGRADL